MRRRRHRARAGTTCACAVCLFWLRVGLQAKLWPSWLVSYKTLALGHGLFFCLFFACAAGGLRLIVAQLALETLLAALLKL